MKVVSIVQARLGSTRLPGKVLQDLCGRTMLGRVIERLRATASIDDVMIATTNLSKDDPIVEECQKHAVSYWRGDESDVLDRYFQSAKTAQADIIVRVTSDCPLIDPEITDKTIRAFLEELPDYAANTLTRTYPRGLDTEVLSMPALTRTWQQAKEGYEREHVTPYIIEHPAEFRLLSVTGDQDYSGHRWTVDTPEDLAFIREVYNRLQGRGIFLWREVLNVLRNEPLLQDMNRSVVQKAIR